MGAIISRCRDCALEAARQLHRPAPASTFADALSSSLNSLLDSERRSMTEFDSLSSVLTGSLQEYAQDLSPPSADILDAHLTARALQWHSSVVELLRRLAADWPTVSTAFDLEPEAELDYISPPLGDLHNGGRSVYRLGFTNGQSIIYKPRSVQGEETFGRIVAHLREQGGGPDLRHCRALDRRGYGWVEYIERRHCNNGEEATRFYWRQGGFLALFWLMCCDDAISDNVVVCGPDPVWIDVECACRPRIPIAESRNAQMPDWIRESLLTTGMIIYGKFKGVPPRHLTGLHVSCAMRRAHVFDAADVLRERYIEAATSGFRQMCTWILEHRAELIADDGALAWWNNRTIRVLLRPTMLYSALVRLWIAVPAAKRLALQNTMRACLHTGVGSNEGTGPWPDDVVEAELLAIKRRDIPYWCTSTTSYDLWESGRHRATGLIEISGLDRVAGRLAKVKSTDLPQQEWLLHSYLGRSATASN